MKIIDIIKKKIALHRERRAMQDKAGAVFATPEESLGLIEDVTFRTH